MRIAEFIDGIWHPHGNRQGLSYGQLAVLFITYVVHFLNHRLSGMEKGILGTEATPPGIFKVSVSSNANNNVIGDGIIAYVMFTVKSNAPLVNTPLEQIMTL
jgi:hypothetical protein